MATIRLYRDDAYETRFMSKVLKAEPVPGKGTWVLLDKTLFYPTAGGQPHDMGRLANGFVIDVENREDEVWHLLDGYAPKEGQEVESLIDWPRRYRHMQRHSAQHLLSQAFLRVNPTFETKAVSLNNPVCTVDFAGEPTLEDLDKAEVLVNEIVYANYAIRCFEVDESEIGRYRLRRPPKVTGRVRLVEMGKWELSACGGTHLKSTAEATPIKVLRAERIKGDLTRVHFMAGLEALEDYRLKHALASQLAQTFSSSVTDVQERVESLQETVAASKREVSSLQERLSEVMAGGMLEQAEPTPHGRLVCASLPESDASLLKPLAQTLSRHDDVIVLLGTLQGERAQLLFTRGGGVTLEMNTLLKAALPHLEGKGGGKPDMAQGGGTKREGLQAALEAAAALAR